MRKLILLPILVLYLVFTSCTNQKRDTKAGNWIFVSILPQKYMVEKIAGDAFKVEAILPPGASPAVFEPTPGQLKGLSHAQAYIRIGEIGFEKAWMDKLASANSKMKIFNQSKSVDFLKATHQHGDYHHDIYDPHIWLSPAEVIVQSQNIYNALVKLMPDSTAYFKENLQKFKATIAEVDKKLLHLFENKNKDVFMVYHPSLSYFARDYQLRQIALEKDGKEPSGQYMAKLIDTCKVLNINTIFIQKQFPHHKADAFAKELNAKVEVIDPLAYNWPENMIRMGKKIQSALGN